MFQLYGDQVKLQRTRLQRVRASRKMMNFCIIHGIGYPEQLVPTGMQVPLRIRHPIRSAERRRFPFPLTKFFQWMLQGTCSRDAGYVAGFGDPVVRNPTNTQRIDWVHRASFPRTEHCTQAVFNGSRTKRGAHCAANHSVSP